MRQALIRAGLVLTLILVALNGAAITLAQEGPQQLFDRTWARTDQPVSGLVVSRTWIWGPEPFTDILTEPYADAPGGERVVLYYDKSRMEDNSYRAEPPWDVTNGLLVVELVTGRVQLGDDQWEQRQPANVNVAGDVDDPDSPTYASFGALLDPVENRGNASVTERVDRSGTVTNDPSLSGQGVALAFYDDVTGHNIADRFWDFMNSTGTVYEDGAYIEDSLFENPFFATGRPITEPYWADVNVAGIEQMVLTQCFERRCLTYTPGNPDGWQVEAGNVGRHYYDWRYGGQQPATEYDFLRMWGLPELDFEMDALVRTDVGPDGNVYLTGPGMAQVLKFSPDGIVLASWGGQGTGDGQFRGPIGVGVDSQGNVYVADRNNNRVQKFDANGNFIARTAPGNFNEPWDVAVGPDDNIYVTLNGNRSVQVFDQDLNPQNSWGEPGEGDGQFIFPMGIAVSDTGLVYVSDLQLDRVQVFNTSGDLLGAFGSTGAGDGELDSPVGLDVLPNGNVYVADAGNNRVQIFSPVPTAAPPQGPPTADVDYEHRGYLIDQDSGRGDFDGPGDIAFGGDGRAYVLDAGNLRVQVFESGGVVSAGYDLVDVWTGLTRNRFSFDNPTGIEVGPDGLVYTTDSRQSKIKRFTSDGGFVDESGPVLPIASGQLILISLDTPADLTFDDDGFIYIADSGANRVFKLTPGGEYVGEFGGPGSGDGQLDSPIGVAVDGAGNVYVADAGNDRVVKFGQDFSFVTAWGGYGSADSQFAIPSDLAISGSRIYVTDGFPNNRVQVFDLDGNFVAAWDGFDIPNGIAIDNAGYVFVTDQANLIQKFTPDGELLAQFATEGSGEGQIDLGSSAPRIALDVSGNVYVADGGNRRVQVFAPQN